jgi:hypothetical protein
MSDLNMGGGGSACLLAKAFGAPSGDANPSGFAGIIFKIERRSARSTFK